MFIINMNYVLDCRLSVTFNQVILLACTTKVSIRIEPYNFDILQCSERKYRQLMLSGSVKLLIQEKHEFIGKIKVCLQVSRYPVEDNWTQ